MDRQDLINTCVFEQFQGLLFSDLSGPLTMAEISASKYYLKCEIFNVLYCDNITGP